MATYQMTYVMDAMGLAVLLLLVQGTTSQNTAPWVRIAHCGGQDSSGNLISGLDFTIDQLKTMATKASRVKICTKTKYGPAESDCITSRPETFPIQNLRRGLLEFGHDGATKAGYCDEVCVSKTWDGASKHRYSNIRVYDQCGLDWEKNHNDGKNGNHHLMYWACGNEKGLHFCVLGCKFCGWVLATTGHLVAYIDSADTTTATTSTITATSTTNTIGDLNDRRFDQLFDATGEQSDMLTDQSVEIKGNSDDITNIKEDVLMNKAKSEDTAELVAELMKRVDTLEGMYLDAQQNISKLTSKLDKATQALSSVPTLSKLSPSCTGNACDSTPAVASGGDNGNSVVLNAFKASVAMETGKCGSVDLCDIVSQIDSVAATLQALADDD